MIFYSRNPNVNFAFIITDCHIINLCDDSIVKILGVKIVLQKGFREICTGFFKFGTVLSDGIIPFFKCLIPFIFID